MDEFEADPTGSAKGSKEIDLKALEQKYELQALIQDTLNTKPTAQIPFEDNLKMGGARGAAAEQLPRKLTNSSFLEYPELDSLTKSPDYLKDVSFSATKHDNHINALVASGSRFNSIVDGIFSMIIPSAEASTSVIGPILAPAPMPVDMEFIFDEGYGYTANSDPFEDLILRTAPLMNAALKIQDAIEYVRYVSKLAAKVFAPETLVDSQRSSKQLLHQDIRAKKDAHKISLYSTAKATMTFNQCWIKALPVEGKAQALVDLADGIHGHIDRLLYPYDYVVGTLKHKALHEINKEYQKICNDYTFKSEVAVQNGTIYDERPNLITGASIVDLITALPYAKDTYYAFDAKFGSADVTEASIRKLVKNIAPEKVVIWQVKPSRMSKTEIKYPKFNSINLNQ